MPSDELEKQLAESTAANKEDVLTETPAAKQEFEASKESGRETGAELESEKMMEREPAAPIIPISTRPTRGAVPSVRDQLTVKVEKILESGLKDTYEKLAPIAQQEFKIQGEETASKIRELLSAAKVKVKKIFQLILEWLMLLPNINRFFLEQEAKIKTDKIIELRKREEEKII